MDNVNLLKLRPEGMDIHYLIKHHILLRFRLANVMSQLIGARYVDHWSMQPNGTLRFYKRTIPSIPAL